MVAAFARQARPCRPAQIRAHRRAQPAIKPVQNSALLDDHQQHPDQVEWFDPESKPLRAAAPYVAWSAWRIDNAGLALDSRTAAAQRASRQVTLHAGDTTEAVVDLGAALDGLRGAGTFSRGWCAQAWLIGGTQPLPSNIVCWPARG
ncbi:MAG TPA: hypothetical protein VF469_11015 [Kofleriaceae bacterium]